tara:strand:+ start:1192 stop:1932 length:741 start_codon:yes stop_codon:yes gene_type:complete
MDNIIYKYSIYYIQMSSLTPEVKHLIEDKVKNDKVDYVYVRPHEKDILPTLDLNNLFLTPTARKKLESWKNTVHNESSSLPDRSRDQRAAYARKINKDTKARVDALNAEMTDTDSVDAEKYSQTVETILTISAIATWAVYCYGVYLNYRNSDDDMIGGAIEDIKNKYDAINGFIKEKNIDIYNKGECPNLSANQRAELQELFNKIGTVHGGGKRKRNKTKRAKRSKKSRKTRAKRSKKSRKTVRRR